jgi:hypothetical protein
MEKIILSEDKRGLEFLASTAQTNLNRLNRIREIAPSLCSEEEILRASARPKAFVFELFADRFPEAKRLSEFSKIEFHLPPDLQELERLLASIGPRSFELVCWDKKSKGWAIDQSDLAAKSDKYRTFIESEAELKLWEAANNFCAVLNGLGIGAESRKKFTSPLLKIDSVPGKGWQLCPDPRGVKQNFSF